MRDPESVDVDGAMPLSEAKAPVHFANLVMDLDACTLALESGEAIQPTRREFALLRFFASHPRRVLSRDMLLDAIAGRRFEPFDRSVDVMVGRLRRKIEPDPKAPRLIVTVPGGYQFAAPLRKARPTAMLEPKQPVGASARPRPPARPGGRANDFSGTPSGLQGAAKPVTLYRIVRASGGSHSAREWRPAAGSRAAADALHRSRGGIGPAGATMGARAGGRRSVRL